MLGKSHHLGCFFVGQVLKVGDFAIWNHHEVPWVVREQIQNGVHPLAASDNECFLIALLRQINEGVTGWLGVMHTTLDDVIQPVRCP